MSGKQIKGSLTVLQNEYPDVYEHLNRFSARNRMGEVRSLLSFALMVKNSGMVFNQPNMQMMPSQPVETQGEAVTDIMQKTSKPQKNKREEIEEIPIFDDALLDDDFGNLT